MSFITVEFAVLLGGCLLLLTFFKDTRIHKLIVLATSCLFYAYWDWRFLGLLAFVTVLDFYISQWLCQVNQKPRRKLLLACSVAANLGFLAFFKYFNFGIDTFNALFMGSGWNLRHIEIILPIGISFYTFETLSYVIDVYRGSTRPAKSLLDYAIFITFFPRLVAGPIMRATQFLPQLERGIQINRDNLVAGTQLFLRGMLKKLVLADHAALMVDQVFSAPAVFSTPTVWLAVGAYSVQILCDFWGYTDMAMGIARILGFELPPNFDLPYTAQSITEFWNRWHISLSTWLRDYLYIPLGGNRKGNWRTYANLMLTMLLGGLWHGASWNFVVWGGLHGTYLALERRLFQSHPLSVPWTSPWAWVRALGVFGVVSITWIPFRSPSWATTLAIFQKLFFLGPEGGYDWFYLGGWIGLPVLIVGGWLARRFELKWPLIPIQRSYTLAWMFLEACVIFFFAATHATPFIYFQF